MESKNKGTAAAPLCCILLLLLVLPPSEAATRPAALPAGNYCFRPSRSWRGSFCTPESCAPACHHEGFTFGECSPPTPVSVCVCLKFCRKTIPLPPGRRRQPDHRSTPAP